MTDEAPGRDRSGELGSVFLERAFPGVERRAFADRLLRWYVEELNPLGDRLRYHEGLAGAEAAQEAARARARVSELLEALRCNRDETVEAARRLLGVPIELPEDAFAPGVILWTLEGASAALRAWAAGLSAESRRVLVAWDEGLHALWR